MYSDRHGQAVSNSYRYFKADGTTAFVVFVQVLDRSSRRHGNASDRPDCRTWSTRTAARPRTRRRLGCRTRAPAATSARVGAGEHRAREYGDRPERRHDEGLRRGLAGVERGAGIECGAGEDCGASLAQTDFVGLAIHCAQGRRHLRWQPERAARPAPGRTGRLQRLSRACSERSTSNPAITGGSPS